MSAPEAEGDIVLDGEMRKQRAVLRHEADTAFLRIGIAAERLTADEHLAAGGRHVDSCRLGLRLRRSTETAAEPGGAVGKRPAVREGRVESGWCV